MNTILVVAAHPDDEILGVGATVAWHVAKGDNAFALILGEGQTSRWDKREDADKNVIKELYRDTLKAAELIGYHEVYFQNYPDNRFDHVDLLDIVKSVENIICRVQPNIVYTHHAGDLNIDHRITAEAVITATRPVGHYDVSELYYFETVSSSEWNFKKSCQNFQPNVFIDIEKFIDVKLKAMNCYQSELCEFPHPRSINGLKVTAQKWGSVIGRTYAEAFELGRRIISREKRLIERGGGINGTL